MREQDSIRVLKGIGEKSEKLFAKLELLTVGDLIRYYPREYDLYSKPVSIGELKAGEKGAGGGHFSCGYKEYGEAHGHHDDGAGCHGAAGSDLV